METTVMKLGRKHHAHYNRGMSLIELSVVIFVLLSLIMLLVIGARAWMKSTDRAMNMMNLRNTQQAMRSYQNLNPLRPDESFTIAMLEEYTPLPDPPNIDITYSPLEVITEYGELWLGPNAAGGIGGDFGPEDGEVDDW